MKKTVITITLLALAFTVANAQDALDPENLSAITAQQKLKEISVSKVEDSGFWYGGIPADNGFIDIREFSGGPARKEPIEDEEQFALGEPDVNVVGAKISFLRRGIFDFVVKPMRPLPIEGITKTISVWVSGRSTQHRIELLVSDHFGNSAIIPMGKLDFSGWKKITVTVPANLKQKDHHFNDKIGLFVDGFNIKCSLDETYGRYYIYFDDIRAVTDLYSEESRDSDDISDSW